MVSKEIKFFDLRRIKDSGQIFRMYEPENGRFVVYSGDRRLELAQSGEKVDFFCEIEEFTGYWEKYFDLKKDYESIVARAEEYARLNPGRGPEFVRKACRSQAGIRVLKQDIWEMMISFIISQQKQIPSIRKCIEGLCARFGEKHILKDGGIWYGFPKAETIASQGLEGLKGLSLGYRERYIYETAVKYMTDALPYDVIEGMGEAAAKKYFCSFTGIGDKVADCVCLFGAGYTDAFPIDVHIRDILKREFAGDITGTSSERLSYSECMKIADENFVCFKGIRGIIQQWIFAYEISEKKF